jgi:predicted phosphodiesterase
MARMLVLGDTHGNLEILQGACRFAKRNDCDRIVQVGDWGYVSPGKKGNRLNAVSHKVREFGLQMFFLDGNHEWYGKMEELGMDLDATEMVEIAEAVTYLPRGLTWEWDGVTFMSLGGAYSIDQDGLSKWFDYWPQETLTYAQGQRAIDAGHVDVMLTHDAPDGIRVLDEMLDRSSDHWRDLMGAKWHFKHRPQSLAHRKFLRAVTDEVQPRVLIHGHYHWRYEDVLHGDDYATKIIGLAHDGEGRDSWVVLDTDEF